MFFGLAQELHVVRSVVCWAELLLKSRAMRDLGFMNLTGALEPPGDSGRIVWGMFVLTVGARERTHECSPRAIRVESSGGFLCCQREKFRFVSGCARAHPWVYPPSPRVIWVESPEGVCQRASVCVLWWALPPFSYFWPIVSRSMVPGVWSWPRD